MANLIGSVQGNRGSVSRLGSKVITSRLATWNHEIRTWLDKDGGYKFEISDKHSGKTLKVVEGKISELDAETP